MLLVLPLLAGCYPTSRRGCGARGPQWAWARRKELVCCPPWAAPAWKGHWMISVCLSLAVAGGVLWTSQQHVELGLLQTAGPRGLLNAGEKRTGAPHGEWDLQLPGSSVPPRGSRPPPHYLLPGTRWTAVSPFKSPKGGRHLPLCVLLWPPPSPPPTAVAPRTDCNRRPGAWREALDLPAAGAGCSGVLPARRWAWRW